MATIRKILTLAAAALALPLAITSCSEDTEQPNEFHSWRERNEQYYESRYHEARNNADGSWRTIRKFSLQDSIPAAPTDFIVARVLKTGDSTRRTLSTDSVWVNYRGHLMPTDHYPAGIVFDQSYTGEWRENGLVAKKFLVKSTVDGFHTALLHMHPGDRWMVYIPTALGYGATVSTSIPAYSTLVFDLELVDAKGK